MNAIPKTDDTDIQKIPLSQLRLSPHNARKTGGTNVQDLVASIPPHGLLQNLTVINAGDGHFDVVAGGRRLRAMQQLLASGLLPGYLVDNVPCLVIDNGAITEASAAENTAREAMHPADQFDAFKSMVDGGKPIADVAAHFGVSDLVVKRRLALAAVAPELMQAYREDQLTLEQLTAYAITEDRKAQLKHWKSHQGSRWDMEPAKIRRTLLSAGIPTTDPRVRAVGIIAYEAAGGALHRDLFDNTGGGFILDEPLLDRLLAEQLAARREEVQAEGWKFVRQVDRDEYYRIESNCSRSQPKQEKRRLTAEESERLVAAKDRSQALDRAIEAEDYEVDEDDPRMVEYEALRQEIEELENPVETWTERQRSNAGAVVHFDVGRGEIVVTRGLIPQDTKKAAAAMADKGKGEKPAPELAESMIRRLTAHRTIALQSALLAKPNIALAVLAHALLQKLFHDHDYEKRTALNVSATNEVNFAERLGFDDVTASPVLKATHEKSQATIKRLGVPGRPTELLPWLLLQKTEAIIELLALVAVYTVNTVVGTNDKSPADGLLQALDIDLADYWQPTAATFFALVPVALGHEALKEAEKADALSHTGHQLFAGVKLSKSEFAGQAESVMRESRWLPKPLRRAGYKPGRRGPVPATTAVKKVAGKSKPAPTKKAAVKKVVKKIAKKTTKTKAKKK
jgi:ParB family chromosome partitioning protein